MSVPVVVSSGLAVGALAEGRETSGDICTVILFPLPAVGTPIRLNVNSGCKVCCSAKTLVPTTTVNAIAHA